MSFDASGIADFWCCPKSHSPLVVDGDTAVCTSSDCRLRFAIQDGIPVMLADEATLLSHDDWNAAVARGRQ